MDFNGIFCVFELDLMRLDGDTGSENEQEYQ